MSVDQVNEAGDPTADIRQDVEIRAVVTRADGIVEDLGILTASYANPIRNWWHQHVIQRFTERRIKAFNARTAQLAKES